MAELNPLLDGKMNGGGGGGGDGGGTGEMIVGPTGKRQRRPSVRLGDIGGEPPLAAYEHLHNHSRRGSSKLQMQYPWKQLQKVSSRLKNNEILVDKDGIKSSEDGIEGEEDNEGDLDLDRVAIGSWKTFRDGSKSKRGRGGSIRKRVRSNWVSSKIDGSEKLLTSGGEGEGDGDEGFHLDNAEEMDRDFGRENLEEEMEELERNESPIRSFDNNNDNEDVDVDRKRGGFLKLGERNGRRIVTTMVSDEMEGPSDSIEMNGVKIWLNQLGLGRYGPVFDIHEVDDEVLPMLTLEDLKDMGINAVGTRRKMYCSIQKLNKGFS